MSFGDILEWLAAAALVTAALLWLGIPLALLTAAVCLAYMAQVYATSSVRLPFRRRGADKNEGS